MPRPLLPLVFLLLTLLAACAASPNVITWETASEVNTAGFNIYRGPSAEGPWTQVNTTLIPPSSDPVQGGKYEYRDAAPVPGQSYYLLEEIELNGASTRYPPTLLAPAGRNSWLLWVGAAAAAAAVGWMIGGRLRSRQSQKQGPAQ
jgi:hypothetical protein